MQYLFDFYFQLTFNTKIFPYLRNRVSTNILERWALLALWNLQFDKMLYILIRYLFDIIMFYLSFLLIVTSVSMKNLFVEEEIAVDYNKMRIT